MLSLPFSPPPIIVQLVIRRLYSGHSVDNRVTTIMHIMQAPNYLISVLCKFCMHVVLEPYIACMHCHALESLINVIL